MPYDFFSNIPLFHIGLKYNEIETFRSGKITVKGTMKLVVDDYHENGCG